MWWQTSNCSPLLIYRPQEDERLSWPGWLTYSGWLTHKWSPISYRSSAGWRKNACQRLTFYCWATCMLYVSLSWAVELVPSLHSSVYNYELPLPQLKLRKLLLLLMLYMQSVSAALCSAHVWPYNPILCLYVKRFSPIYELQINWKKCSTVFSTISMVIHNSCW